jgi:UDP-N-acetylglucosamine 2-epimerase (non-hydrolysing)
MGNIFKDYVEIEYNDKLISEVLVSNRYNNNVLGIVLATKPCFYKLWSLVNEAEKKNLPCLLINSGQHYDDLVGYGIKELDLDRKVAINLHLKGDLSQKSAELFIKLKEVSEHIKKINPNMNLIPYVNGDTITAAILPAAWMFATNQKCIHGEAGLRSMSPRRFIGLKDSITPEELIKIQDNEDWITNRTEPFPEQFDTFVGSAACEYMFAPVELNRKYLINEGYNPKKIFTVGNTVVDVIEFKKKLKSKESIFELYPALDKDEWIRFDIHRRDNLTHRRFFSIIKSIVTLVKSGKNVCLVELNATKSALENYGLRQKLLDLSRENKNFLFTPLWKEYGHVMEFLHSERCQAIVTDSGSMQEELNEIGKPCMTIRFNTDRPETVMYGKTNLLIPPLKDKMISDTIKYVIENDYFKDIKKAKKLYGIKVGKKIIGKVEDIFSQNDKMFSWAHEELEIYKDKKDTITYL